jgi:hypothetical protein
MQNDTRVAQVPSMAYDGRMAEILIRREILKAVEWLGGSPAVLARLRGADKRKLYEALEKLEADRELLAAVGSWLDTWTDDQVLEELRKWNGWAAADAIEKVRQGHGAMKPPADG